MPRIIELYQQGRLDSDGHDHEGGQKLEQKQMEEVNEAFRAMRRAKCEVARTGADVRVARQT